MATTGMMQQQGPGMTGGGMGTGASSGRSYDSCGKDCLTRDIMCKSIELALPTDTVVDVARIMKRLNVGYLPVVSSKGADGKIVGMITDRDLAVRVLAEGKDPNTPIETFYTKDVKYVYDDQKIEEVARNMAQLQVRRLPVVTRDKKLVGVVTLGDIARNCPDAAKLALHGISQPSSQHSQSEGGWSGGMGTGASTAGGAGGGSASKMATSMGGGMGMGMGQQQQTNM